MKRIVMPIITIHLTGEPVTQEQRDALIARSTIMIKDVLHQDPQATGVLIEETGAAGRVGQGATGRDTPFSKPEGV